MNNSTNLYDIDDKIIRSAGDNHKITVQEASAKMEEYRKKILEVGEDSPKAVIYATYMRNLSQYILSLYAQMTPEELNAEIAKVKAQKDVNEQVKQAMEELQKELSEEQTTPGSMDEYVNYEEIEPVTIGGENDGTSD